jgi:hypothetical protein
MGSACRITYPFDKPTCPTGRILMHRGHDRNRKMSRCEISEEANRVRIEFQSSGSGRISFAANDLGYVAPDRVATVTTQLIDSGVDILELRTKQRSKAEIVRFAEAMLPITHSAGIPLIVNDHLICCGMSMQTDAILERRISASLRHAIWPNAVVS